jgi:hypothetical protein
LEGELRLAHDHPPRNLYFLKLLRTSVVNIRTARTTLTELRAIPQPAALRQRTPSLALRVQGADFFQVSLCIGRLIELDFEQTDMLVCFEMGHMTREARSTGRYLQNNI